MSGVDAGGAVARVMEVARTLVTDPTDPSSWDDAQLEAAVQLGRDQRLRLTFTADVNGARPDGAVIGVVDGRDVDLTRYNGALVEVLGEDEPRDAEPLWHVRLDDGTVIPAWTSELGL